MVKMMQGMSLAKLVYIAASKVCGLVDNEEVGSVLDSSLSAGEGAEPCHTPNSSMSLSLV